MSFAEKGAVSDIEPAFFIGYLHRVKATGTLKFEDAPLQRAVYFRDGRVLFCSSNAPDDQLGAILIAAGKIGQEQFDAIVAGLEPKQSIAAALAQGGHVSQRDIGDAARRKVEQIIGSCCAQTTGSYEFEDGVLPKGALDLKLTTEKVLIAAFEVLEPSGFLNRILKSPMAVLTSGETEPGEAELVKLRAALDGVSSLADIGGAVGLPLAATEARAAVLVILGAASVVTSQIEEMALPDINEGGESPSFSLQEESEPVEAETIAFMQAPESIDAPDLSATASNLGPGIDSGIGSGISSGIGSGLDSESTLILPAGENAFAGGSDATLVMGQGLDLQDESDSGLVRNPGVPKRDKASAQDLDAIKELIGAPSRPGMASIPNERWDPVLSAEGRPGRKRAGLGGLIQNQTVVRAAIAVIVLVIAGVGWMLYSARQSPSGPAPQPLAEPTLIAAATPAVPATALPSPGAAASPVVSGSPIAAATLAPTAAATPSPKVAPSVAAPTPTPAPKATPTPKSTPAPTVAPTANPAPTKTATVPATSSGTASSGYESLKAGRLAEASVAFEASARARANDFSVQLLVACSAQTITKALQNDSSPDLFVLPATISGKPCHRMMRGFFKTQAEAAQAISSLPAYYVNEGAKPRAVPIKTVLR